MSIKEENHHPLIFVFILTFILWILPVRRVKVQILIFWYIFCLNFSCLTLLLLLLFSISWDLTFFHLFNFFSVHLILENLLIFPAFDNFRSKNLGITVLFVLRNNISKLTFVGFELFHMMTAALNSISWTYKFRHNFENSLFPKYKTTYLRCWGLWNILRWL